MTTTLSWGNASEILAAAGVPDNPEYYAHFSDPNVQAVLTIPLRVQKVWEANDAKGWADIFTEDGGALVEDRQLVGRAAIQAYMEEAFQRFPFKGSRVTGSTLFVNFITDDVALLVTNGGTLVGGQTELPPEQEVRNTWVIVRRAEGELSLFSHQSSPIKG
ncbi:SgcJ/EcaC family oxidoreductase [Catellatospora tritici]|uniref:SgcJ/EcaC family oxidoreductase n=1 Tax=Catellatospora tritici TaxID=2851566 RepID=UPI001C2DECBA|nr:SgcJ/EcaC family oxidoreductase [Catellatospora tritici]MBV1849372.1 SgcJ/EcaC family oxidoreductase [Catellatospora tritici]